MGKRAGKTYGFTLIEVLAAMAIVAVIAAALYSSVHIAFRARRSTQAQLTLARSARLTQEALARDLQSALPPTGVLAGAFVGQDLVGVTATEADTVTLHCTRGAGRSPGALGDVRQIMFALSETPDQVTGAFNLVRRVSEDLLAPIPDPPSEQVICRGVLALKLRYYDGVQWLDSWDSATRENTLPNAVEITLDLATDSTTAPTDAQATSHRVVQVILLPCASPLPPEPGDLAPEAETP